MCSFFTNAQGKNKDGESYWNNELSSLGVDAKRKNDLNDSKELSELTENLKQTMYQDYKTAYDNAN